MPTLIHHGHVCSDAGMSFYVPKLSKGTRMAAHLLATWIRDRERPNYQPPRTIVDPRAREWDGQDVGEERDQT